MCITGWVNSGLKILLSRVVKRMRCASPPETASYGGYINRRNLTTISVIAGFVYLRRRPLHTPMECFSQIFCSASMHLFLIKN